MYECLPFLPIVSWFWPSDHSLMSQADEVYESVTARMVSCCKENSEQFSCTIHNLLASFNMSPMCLGALCGHLLSNGANW